MIPPRKIFWNSGRSSRQAPAIAEQSSRGRAGCHLIASETGHRKSYPFSSMPVWRRAVEESLAEASLDELLDDPIARALMERDGVDSEELRRLLAEIRRLREAGGP
jgi:hypothetical protein